MSRSRRTCLAALATAVTIALACSTARAQGPSDAAAAEALFNEAQRLAQAGKYEQACPKYAESVRLEEGIGVRLYLADCYERMGRTASAWAQFREAEDLATKQDDKRAATARQRAAALEPQLARLVVQVEPGADAPALEVRRDDTLVGRAQWGLPVPVDPGPHTVVATAPGKKPRRLDLAVTPGAPAVASIGPLDDDAPGETAAPAPVVPATSSPAEPPLPPLPPGGTQRMIAYAVAGVGVAGIVVGSVFGFDTISKNNASNAGPCHPDNTCDNDGLSLRKAAERSAAASTIAFVAGGAAVAAGAVLYVTAPRARVPVGLVPTVDVRSAGLLVSVAW